MSPRTHAGCRGRNTLLQSLCARLSLQTMNPGSSLRIGRILGIPIYIHASWVIIFVLITMQLGAQFAAQHPQWTRTQHWSVGVVTSLLFFASILFHEMSHSLVARAYKIRVDSITLFVFGGVARIGQEASN